MGGFPIRAGVTAIALVIATTLSPFPAAVQAPKQQQPPTFRGTTNIVRVDVTVTGRGGEPATDLARDDLIVTGGGAPQAFGAVELVRVTGQATDDRSLDIYSTSQVASEAARDD